MKKTILIALTVLVASFPPVAHAGERSLTIVLAGAAEADGIAIGLSPDGRSYTIASIAALEVGGGVCTHPAGNPDELLCDAAPIAGFEVNAGAGDDVVTVGHEVPVPVTLRGGGGDDKLAGAAGNDKLIGGPGNDVLVGRAGDDWISGGPGNDKLIGGPGDDTLYGGPGQNTMLGGTGTNEISVGPLGG